MKDEDLADELITRLNDLAESPEVSRMLIEMMETRIEVSGNLAEHPTIQVDSDSTVGLMGLLNGICGIRMEEPLMLYGHITACVRTRNSVRFERTVNPNSALENLREEVDDLKRELERIKDKMSDASLSW